MVWNNYKSDKGAKRKRKSKSLGGPRSLQDKVRDFGGTTGSFLDAASHSNTTNQSTDGIYGKRAARTPNLYSMNRTFATPRNNNRPQPSTPAARSVTTTHSRLSRFSRASSSSGRNGTLNGIAVHVVCAVSENLARETCVASMDAGAPTTLHVTKQGNGQTYAETIAYLQVLKPDEVLLNEGRRNSPLARKIMEWYSHGAAENTDDENYYAILRDDEHDISPQDDRFGALTSSVVVKFVSRSLFDQTKGSTLLKSIAREETYEATVVEEYILLSSSHALLHYVQQSLGATFAKNSVHLNINAGGNNRMVIDRSTMLQLELLVNSKTGKAKDCLVGTIDKTKTTVGSRLLRTNLMSPPTRVDTINARLELVELFMSDEEFFYNTMEHLTRLPDVDKMLSNVALVPRKPTTDKGERTSVNARIASKGISALVCIKSTLQALPLFAGTLNSHLRDLAAVSGRRDDATIATDRSSLLVGLGGGNATQLTRNHLLRAILFAMTQPELATVLEAVTNVFTETTTFSRNANAMRHHECFALKCGDSEMMTIVRRAFLSNVDDIYSKADEYAEVFGFSVAVRHTASRGYFLAVPFDVGTDLPSVFLQPTKSGRFINCTTEEISSLNIRAKDNVHDLLLMTHDRIQEVMSVARAHYDAIATLCDSIALLDLCHSFADHVTQQSVPWCHPLVTDSDKNHNGQVEGQDHTSENGSSVSVPGRTMIIRNGRYPIDVLESHGLTSDAGMPGIIPNDTYTPDDKPFTVITGINGSGKSTYLKQVALITILAHCGSYVPAAQATIPSRDRICCRIGNADDQEHNISTFLLEMKETAFLCNFSTSRSLVLVDELGRATSNEDGVALAWATAEYLLKKKAITFFVTHYSQLKSLENIYPAVQNIHMEAAVERQNGDISYTHKVKKGCCTVSCDYGVELAASCGWPAEVVEASRVTQDKVSALLPDNSICRESMDDAADPLKTQAYQKLVSIGLDLKALIVEGGQQTFDSLRSALCSVAENRIGENSTDLLRAMDQILFRESIGNHYGPSPPSNLSDALQPEQLVEHNPLHNIADAGESNKRNKAQMTGPTEAETSSDGSSDGTSDLSSDDSDDDL